MVGTFAVLAVAEGLPAGVAFIRMKIRQAKNRALYWRRPGEKESPIDSIVLKQRGRPRNYTERLAVKAVDFGVNVLRKVVHYQAFRWFVEALVLSNSKLRRGKGGDRWLRCLIRG
jgi:hypothetical protein